MSLITDKDYITLSDKLESLPTSARQKFLTYLGVGLKVSFIGYCGHNDVPPRTDPIQFYGDWKWNNSPYHKKVEYYVGCFIAPPTRNSRWVCVHSSVWLSQRKRVAKHPEMYRESMDFRKAVNTLGLFGFTQRELIEQPHLVIADAIRKATLNFDTMGIPTHAVRLHRYHLLNSYGKAFATDDTLVLVVLPNDPALPLKPDQVLALSRADLDMLMRYI